MLDIRTVLALTMSSSYILGLYLMYFSYARERIKGFYTIGVALFIQGSGFLLIFLRDYLSDFSTVVIANTLIIIAIAVIGRGLAKFRIRSGMDHYGKDILLIIVFAVFFTVWTYVIPSVNARIIVISLYEIYYFLFIIYILYSEKDPAIVKESKAIAWFFIVGVLLFTLRIFLTLNEAPIASFMNAGFVHALAIIYHQIMPFALTLGCFWLSNKLMENKLLNDAMVDGLTGLYNHNAFEKLAYKEWHRSRRHGYTCGLVMCDLDHFKVVNDKYGHIAGDETLKVTAETLKDEVRLEDIVGRYGGEEFILLLLDIEKEQFLGRLENLRKSIEEQTVHHNKATIKVTMSFGACILSGEELDLKKAIEVADKALYTAKSNGRNKVEFMAIDGII